MKTKSYHAARYGVKTYPIHPAPTCGGNVDGMRTSAAGIRDHAAATLSPETQQRLEQFLMPAPVADQAAN